MGSKVSSLNRLMEKLDKRLTVAAEKSSTADSPYRFNTTTTLWDFYDPDGDGLDATEVRDAQYPDLDWTLGLSGSGSKDDSNEVDDASKTENKSGACRLANRNSAQTLFVLLTAVTLAELVRDVASRICDQMIVVVVGGNGSLACIVADVIYLAVRGVYDHIILCEDLLSAAEDTASYNRLAHLHNDLSELRTFNDTHNAALAAHDANIDADLVAHDTNIDGDLAQHDRDIKDLLTLLQGGVDNANRQLLVALAMHREMVRLLLTPEGRRMATTGVLACDGDAVPCPDVLPCPGGQCGFDFPLKK